MPALLYGENKNNEGAVKISVNTGRDFCVTERSDWLRYDNEVYTGHSYREVRSLIKPEKGEGAGGDLLFRGYFYVLEETLRDARKSVRPVNEVVPAAFSMSRTGEIRLIEDRGFPAFRGFPVYPEGGIKAGDKWTGSAERAVDPLNNGNIVVVPIVAEYEYKGAELYRGIPVFRVAARYASRYGDWNKISLKGNRRKFRSGAESGGNGVGGSAGGKTPGGGGVAGDKNVVEESGPFSALSGSHNVDIIINAEDGNVLFLRDTLDETYMWEDGSTVRFDGFSLSFGTYLSPVNRPALEKAVDGIPEIKFEPVNEGLRLTIKNLQFRADSDELLASEAGRLDGIAGALLNAGEKTFRVEGHTAATGKEKAEKALSEKRAKRIADELVKRGIGAEHFIYSGAGSGKPVGDNSTEAGRAENRRVEITILE